MGDEPEATFVNFTGIQLSHCADTCIANVHVRLVVGLGTLFVYPVELTTRQVNFATNLKILGVLSFLRQPNRDGAYRFCVLNNIIADFAVAASHGMS